MATNAADTPRTGTSLRHRQTLKTGFLSWHRAASTLGQTRTVQNNLHRRHEKPLSRLHGGLDTVSTALQYYTNQQARLTVLPHEKHGFDSLVR